MERFCCDDLCEQGRDCPVRNQRRIQVSDKPWIGLTKAEFEEAVEGLEDLEDCWMMIEARLREKNK